MHKASSSADEFPSPSFPFPPFIKKTRIAGSSIGFGQKIVNGNEPQRAAQAKNDEKTPKKRRFTPSA